MYRSMPAGIAQSEHVGKMTDTHKQKAEKELEMPVKPLLYVGNIQIR